MKITSVKKENEKIKVNNLGLRKDEAFQRYKDLRQEINTLIRKINMKFDFKNFTKETLQPLEEVSGNSIFFQHLEEIKTILKEEESTVSEIISKGHGNRAFYNLLLFGKKIKENLSKFSIDKKISIIIEDINKKIQNIESQLNLKEEERIKIKPAISDKKVYNRVIIKKNNNAKENAPEKMTKQPLFNQNNKNNKFSKNNLETSSFNYSEEQLDKNIFEITKNNKKIISFIDIDLLLQLIAQGKNIYDDPKMENSLLDGFCVQHTAFISSDVLISKIISCFNYFYSRYLNQNN